MGWVPREMLGYAKLPHFRNKKQTSGMSLVSFEELMAYIVSFFLQ